MEKTGKELQKDIQLNMELLSLVFKYNNETTVKLTTKK